MNHHQLQTLDMGDHTWVIYLRDSPIIEVMVSSDLSERFNTQLRPDQITALLPSPHQWELFRWLIINLPESLHSGLGEVGLWSKRS